MTSSTIIAIILLLVFTFVMGAITSYLAMTNKPDGLFVVNLYDIDEDPFKLQIDVPLEEIPDMKYLIFKIRKIQ